MGRPAKAVVTNDVVEANVADLDTTVAEVKADVVEAPKAVEKPAEKSVGYSFSASFKTRNREGEKINHKYKGTGKTLLEAIEDVVGSDEDLTDEYNKPFPSGININVVVTLRTSAGHEFSRNVAPHVARNILEDKNVVLAAKLLGA